MKRWENRDPTKTLTQQLYPPPAASTVGPCVLLSDLIGRPGTKITQHHRSHMATAHPQTFDAKETKQTHMLVLK